MKTPLHSSAVPARTARAQPHLVSRRACLWAVLVLLAGLAFGPPPAAAAVTEAWVQRYNGPANSDDYASAVAVDGSGNVAVTGSSYNGTNYDYYTAKYAATNGALLWEHRYNGPADSDDFPNAVAVDGSGNVVVTGYANNADYNADYYTAKYAAADGALLWDQRYNGPANSDDSASAVAVDGSGNVVVTGTSYNGINNDYYTAKYAGADGALLWERRYNGPANGDDKAASLALGLNGMVAVTGSSIDSSGTYDYATVVYQDDVYPISIALVPDGVRLRFIGIPGRRYRLQRATSATGPWTTSAPQIAPVSGLVELLDVFPPPGQAFYRTVQP